MIYRDTKEYDDWIAKKFVWILEVDDSWLLLEWDMINIQIKHHDYDEREIKMREVIENEMKRRKLI